MKRTILVTLVLFGIFILAGSWPSETSATTPRESAVVEFADLVKLGGVLLRGEYLVVHDEQRMANGEACTYIYRGKQIDVLTGKPSGFAGGRTPSEIHSIRAAKLSARISSGWMLNEELRASLGSSSCCRSCA